MATPKGSPTVPTAPITRNGLWTSDGWIIFFNSIIAWLKGLFLRGTRAQQPAANTVFPGTLYYVTDEGVIEISDGVNWLPYSGIGSVFVDAAGALDGDGTVGDPLAVRVDGDSVVVNASNNLEAVMHRATLEIDDDGIKALPSGVVQVVPAAPAGYRVKVLGGTWRLDSSNGAYTNVDPTYAVLLLGTASGSWLYGVIANDSTVAPTPLTELTDLLGSAWTKVFDMFQPGDVIQGAVGPRSWLQNYPPANMPTVADLDSEPLYVFFDNNGAGDLTGGGAGNTLLVTVYWCYEAL